MSDWRYSVGNLVNRAIAAPAAVSPAAQDPLLPLSNLGSGYPDEQGGLQWRSDGTYAIDFDLNLLADESDSAAAPTGWLDLLNLLAGTPGHTVLREARIAADHNAYHIGEFAILRQVMGTWPQESRASA